MAGPGPHAPQMVQAMMADDTHMGGHSSLVNGGWAVGGSGAAHVHLAGMGMGCDAPTGWGAVHGDNSLEMARCDAMHDEGTSGQAEGWSWGVEAAHAMDEESSTHSAKHLNRFRSESGTESGGQTPVAEGCAGGPGVVGPGISGGGLCEMEGCEVYGFGCAEANFEAAFLPFGAQRRSGTAASMTIQKWEKLLRDHPTDPMVTLLLTCALCLSPLLWLPVSYRRAATRSAPQY